TDSPAGLVAAAAAAGVDVLAITDHDTTSGWAQAVEALPPGMRLVRGAEFSCVSPTGRAERDVAVQRLRAMTGKMAADGYPVDPDEVLSLLPDGASAGRPHLARALVAAGVVASVDEAFATLLYTGSPYYAPKVDTPVRTAIAMIRDAGGVPVFAHPLARRRGRVVEPSVLVELAAAGLGGVEVDHPDHAPEDRELLRALAAEHGLVTTGSSDYHGTNKTTPVGAERTAPDALDALVERTSGAEVVVG